MSKPNALQSALRNAASSTKPVASDPATAPAAVTPQAARATRQAKAAVQAGRQGLSGITVFYPEAVRRQLKMMGAEMDRNMDDLVAEGLNMLFAKYRKPEIAPRKGGKID